MAGNQKINEKLIEKRCSDCNALLAKASLKNGKVEIKCKCGKVNAFETEQVNASRSFSSFDVTVQQISKI